MLPGAQYNTESSATTHEGDQEIEINFFFKIKNKWIRKIQVFMHQFARWSMCKNTES